MITQQLLPPPLIHELRARSFSRLFRITGNPGNRGFGRFLRQRIHMFVRREKTRVEQAITVAYLGCYLTDHIVFAEKEAARLIEQRELGDTEEQEIWVRNYHGVIMKLIDELPDGRAILDEMGMLDRYTRLPATLDSWRGRHWRRIQSVLRESFADIEGNFSEIPVVTRIHDALASRREAASKARSVCLAASMLADMECWSSHMPWPEAYRKVMTELYPLLSRHPAVLEQIIRLR